MTSYDDSFYSRLLPPIQVPLRIETEINQTTPNWAKNNATTLGSYEEAYLFQDTRNWQATLLGQPSVSGKRFAFHPGALVNALSQKKRGLVLYDPPVTDASFNDWMQTTLSKKEIFVNGIYYPIPDDFTIVVKNSPRLTRNEVNWKTEEPAGREVFEINSSNYATLFSYVTIDEKGYVHDHPEGLLGQYQHFVLTTPIPPEAEQKLLHYLKQTQKSISERIVGHESARLVQNPLPPVDADVDQALPQSRLIFSNDPYWASKKIHKETSDASYTQCVDLNTSWSDLIENLEIESYNPLKIKQTASPFLEALRSGKTVIFYGQMKLDLYQRISSVFNQHQYLFVNGEKITLNGQLIFITTAQSDPLYAQAIQQETQEVTLSAYQQELEQRFNPENAKKLILLYQIAAQQKINLPLNLHYLETCLQQLANPNALVAKEKIIKSVLLSNYSHRSEEYACINVLAKILFSENNPKPLSDKRKLKLTLLAETIASNPWQVANCFTGPELMTNWAIGDPFVDLPKLFDSEKGRIQPTVYVRKKLAVSVTDTLPKDTQAESFLDKQQRRFEDFLTDKTLKVLVLQGDPGIGKTHLVHSFDGQKFWGKDAVLEFLTSTKPGVKLLVLDEYNLEDNEFWSFFETISAGYVRYRGKEYKLNDDQKIVCTCNPSYFPERKKQTTIPSQALTLYFKHPKDIQLLKIIDKELSKQGIENSNSLQNLFLSAYHLAKKDFSESVSLRDLSMLCQRFARLKKTEITQTHVDVDTHLALNACIKQFTGFYPNAEAQQLFKKTLCEKFNYPMPAEPVVETTLFDNGYALPSSRASAWNLILEDIALLRNQERSKGGILMEGESGIGKTRIYTEALDKLGLPYYVISSGSQNVIETIRKAVQERKGVVLDELNLDPALEKVLGQYLSGVDEAGNPLQHSDFFVLASQNPSHYAGREKLSASFINRFHRITLADYTTEDFIAIATQRLRDPAVALEFVHGYLQVKKEGVLTINSRNFFEKLDEFINLPTEEQASYISKTRELLEIESQNTLAMQALTQVKSHLSWLS